jgi:hypothetical protein
MPSRIRLAVTHDFCRIFLAFFTVEVDSLPIRALLKLFLGATPREDRWGYQRIEYTSETILIVLNVLLRPAPFPPGANHDHRPT